MRNKITKIIPVAAILLCLFFSSSEASAQTSKRKKKTKSQTAPTTQIATSPVSRNGQYLDGNQIVLGDFPQSQTTPTTTETSSTETPVTTTDENADLKNRVKELNSRLKKLETNKESQYDEKQKRLALNLDILTKAESRAESLRKQLFEIIEKESTVQTRLEQIEYDARPETIDRSLAMVGSLRPEEIRDQRKKSLEIEKTNLQTLLTQIQTNRSTLQVNVEKADLLVEKVRLKLDKDIDDALASDEDKQ